MNQRLGQDHGPQLSKPDAATVYALFSELIYADQPLTDTLAGVSVLAQRALSEAWEASLTLVEGRHVWTAVNSGPVAFHLDQWQYDSGRGPCLDAAHSRTAIELTVGDAGQPYPDFRRAAQGSGITHTISVGLSTGNEVRGSMNLYSFTGRSFNDDSDRMVRSLAFCAGMVLAHVERHRVAAARTARIEAVLQSRSLIEQAKGILMRRYRCTSDEAFRMLIELAQQRQVKLEAIVHSIVDKETQARPGASDPA